MDTTQKPDNIISFCTGMRGLERGIERTGYPIRTVCYVEIEAFICLNLVKQMEAGVVDEAPIWTDLKTFDSSKFRGRIHGFTGGYPCQPVSLAGARKGTEDPRHLWPYIKNHIEAIRPLWCFFENVPGHLTLGYEQVRADLQGLGYTVEEGIFSAEEVGAPHRRERLFILAVKEELGDATSSGLQEPGQNRVGELSEEDKQRLDDRFEQSSEKLAHTDSIGHSYSEPKEQSTERGINALSNPTTGGKESMAKGHDESLSIPNSEGCERNQQFGENNERSEKSYKSIAELHNGTFKYRWPAKPGQQQYEWEAKREVESGLGVTIDGYNFREDLVRMAGNGVVEQTASKAWIELWSKHLKK